MTLVVVPIHAATHAGLLAHADEAKSAGADLVEVRLDLCFAAGMTVDTAVGAGSDLPLPFMATLRHRDEGGSWSGSEADRRSIYERMPQAGWVDIEAARFTDAAWNGFRPSGKLVLSLHDFQGMGGDLAERVRGMYTLGAEVAKLAVTAKDGHDLAAIERVLRWNQRPLIAIAMGEHGLPSRLLAGVWGAAMTFARLPSGGTAPGQPTVQEVLGLYHLRRQGPNTRIYGVIGSPISHSLSPVIHNCAIDHTGLDAVYVPFRVEDAQHFWQSCGSWIAGLSVTLPHKEALPPLMDRLEDLAVASGAMNTVYRERGQVVGANTDAAAIAHCLEHQLGSLAGRRVLVLGAGGVARAAALSCHSAGAAVAIANRTADRARALAASVGATAVPWDQAVEIDYDVLINGTSVGMRKDGNDPDDSPWPAQAHRAGTTAFDTVYVPLETRFLKEAHRAGCRTLSGLDMFIAQADGQFHRWFGHHAPTAQMRRAALERLSI
ncbi:shikimate dehydrogenase [Planctomycetota bacterium]|nr:shikimate dehydrogenase [Planctomycetota bacterium]